MMTVVTKYIAAHSCGRDGLQYVGPKGEVLAGASFKFLAVVARVSPLSLTHELRILREAYLDGLATGGWRL